MTKIIQYVMGKFTITPKYAGLTILVSTASLIFQSAAEQLSRQPKLFGIGA
jgi:hypothetical protein